MDRLTFMEDGKIKVCGMNRENQNELILKCIEKLYRYEATRLSPEDIEKIKNKEVLMSDKMCCETCRYFNAASKSEGYICTYYIENNICNQALNASKNGYCPDFERRSNNAW